MQFLDEIVRRIPASQYVQVQEIREVSDVIEKVKLALIFVCVSNTDDLAEVLRMLISNVSKIKLGFLRIIVFNKIDNKQIVDVMKAKGVAEVLSYLINKMALTNTIQKQLDIAEKAVSKNKGHAQSQSKKVNRLATFQSKSQQQISWIKPLEIYSDCWLFKGKSIRFVAKKWLIEGFGPGPVAGSWERVDLTKNTSEAEWIWKETEKYKEVFIKETGAWYFFGRQPEFDWKINNWRFVSSKPVLFFKSEKELNFRFQYNQQTVQFEICNNSIPAKYVFPKIIETFGGGSQSTASDVNSEKEMQDLYNDAQKSTSVESETQDYVDTGNDGPESKWNDSVSEDEENDLPNPEMRLSNKYNSGRGIGMGQANGTKSYRSGMEMFDIKLTPDTVNKKFSDSFNDKDLPKYKTGSDAFSSMKLLVFVTLNGKAVAVNVIENNSTEIIFESKKEEFKANTVIPLYASINKDPNLTTKVNINIDSIDEIPESDHLLVAAKISVSDAQVLDKIFNQFKSRQNEIKSFFKDARGEG